MTCKCTFGLFFTHTPKKRCKGIPAPTPLNPKYKFYDLSNAKVVISGIRTKEKGVI